MLEKLKDKLATFKDPTEAKAFLAEMQAKYNLEKNPPKPVVKKKKAKKKAVVEQKVITEASCEQDVIDFMTSKGMTTRASQTRVLESAQLAAPGEDWGSIFTIVEQMLKPNEI